MWDLRGDVFDPLLELVLPRHCVGCRRPGVALCGECAPGDGIHRLQIAGLDVVAAGRYADGLRAALLAYKERGRRDLARPLGRQLGAAVAQSVAARQRGAVARARAPQVVLVWPPSSPAVVAARGGDHLGRLARHAAVLAGVRVAPGVLVPTRQVLDSAGLGIAARAENLRGSMRALPPPGSRPRTAPGGASLLSAGAVAVVVDDIVTTGATLREAGRALAEAGWTVFAAAVVAATPRRVPPQPLAVPRSAV
ncbi:MAG: phosphoribosyltransferase family protein [Jatrophihabitans sp.]